MEGLDLLISQAETTAGELRAECGSPAPSREKVRDLTAELRRLAYDIEMRLFITNYNPAVALSTAR